MKWSERITQWINPSKNPDLQIAFQRQTEHMPILWLLGKTGAGKSSLIQALTGDSRIDIGNGFQPCTLTAQTYDYPNDKPLFRFLDTRGLAEANYDASADIAACENRSHALLIVMKADDPEQSDVLKALKQIRASGKIQHALVVHTGILQIPNLEQRQQAIAHNQQQVEQVMGRTLPSVSVDFMADEAQSNVGALRQQLADFLPILAQLGDVPKQADQEARNFARLKKEILWYAGAAAASDTMPAVGLFAVPTIQGKMLHSMAKQYGIASDSKLLVDFAKALGSTISTQYSTRLGIRQLVKFIPAYGQTVGAAAAASMSFATTYALGRAANKYLYQKAHGETVDTEELRALYQQALTQLVPFKAEGKEREANPNQS